MKLKGAHHHMTSFSAHSINVLSYVEHGLIPDEVG